MPQYVLLADHTPDLCPVIERGKVWARSLEGLNPDNADKYRTVARHEDRVRATTPRSQPPNARHPSTPPSIEAVNKVGRRNRPVPMEHRK